MGAIYLVTGAKEFGALLRGLRKARGWTQATLAGRAGLLPKTVSALENGTDRALVATLMRCLSALDADLLIKPRQSASALDIASRPLDVPRGKPTTARASVAKAQKPAKLVRPSKSTKESW